MTDTLKFAANLNGETAQKISGDETSMEQSYVNASQIEDATKSLVIDADYTDVTYSNDNNPNGDGDNTPPPALEKTTDKTAEEACSALGLYVAQNAEKVFETSLPNLETIPEENRALVIPSDPKELNTFVTVGNKALEAAQKLLDKPNTSVSEYIHLKNQAKKYGEAVLDAALKLSVQINSIVSHQGYRSDLNAEKPRTKEQILQEDFGLSEKESRKFKILTPDAVNKEKNFCRENDEIPTLQHALTYVKSKNKKLDKAKAQAAAKEERPVIDGKYDIIYGDYNNLPEDLVLSGVSNDNALLVLWAEKNQFGDIVDIMLNNGFTPIDSSAFITIKVRKGGKYFQGKHANVFVGMKGEFDEPFAFKSPSVVYEKDIDEGNGFACYADILKQSFPDATVLNLIEPATEADEEVEKTATTEAQDEAI